MLKARGDVLNSFKSNLFPIISDATPRESFMCQTSSQQKRNRTLILTPKQMLRKLPITLAQIKSDNNSESLLNEIMRFILCINQNKLLKKYITTKLNQ